MNRALKGKIVEFFGTQADFAQALGIDESVVSRVVTGRKKLNGELKRKWAEFLRCSPSDIFGGQNGSK